MKTKKRKKEMTAMIFWKWKPKGRKERGYGRGQPEVNQFMPWNPQKVLEFIPGPSTSRNAEWVWKQGK